MNTLLYLFPVENLNCCSFDSCV